MKQLKSALQKSGFKGSKPVEKNIPKYKIFHLPSAQYVCTVVRVRRGKEVHFFYKPVIVRGEAAAGHIRDSVCGRRYNPNQYKFQNEVAPTQLHKSCFDLHLVEDNKDFSK